jgi:site-specific DNA recombinase
MRAVIYARYSSDRQSEASIEDQVEVCRRLIERQGWQLGAVYSDRALSGGSAARPGYQKLLRDLPGRRFDVVVIEALDRLGRRLSDVAALHDDLAFRGVRLWSASMGELTPLHIGILGTMAQHYLSDLRDKTRRGQLGRVLQGRIAGGNAYGYDVIDDAQGGGGRRINEPQAEVVRRIFRLYAAGESPRIIARKLNTERVPGPGGRPWQDTTIRGQVERGTGLLNNELYAGLNVWNHCSYVKDPRTGKRVARPNPPEQWENVAVPDLRIVDDALWLAVKARQQEVGFRMTRDDSGNALNRAHRRKYMLSGLLECGVCGGGYTIMAKERYGCAGHRNKGTCTNDRTISRQEIEGRVLTALRQSLLAPGLFEEFARTFQEEVNRRNREAFGQRAGIEGELKQVERRIGQIVRAVEDGLYQASMKTRLVELEAEKARLENELADTEAPSPISLHPNLPALYRRKVEDLEKLLTDPELAAEAMDAIAALIRRVVLTPRADAPGLDAVLHGDLAEILALCDGAGPNDRRPAVGTAGRQVSVVAGAGFEPATFRL